MQDMELVDLIKKDPNKGLNLLMTEYMGLICTIVRDKLGKVCDEFEIESCASDVFIDFYNNIDRYSEEKGSVKALLCVVAKRRAIDIFRKRAKEINNISLDDDEGYTQISDNTDIEDSYIKKEQKKKLLEAVKSLGSPDSEIIVRKYYMGESSKEIAEKLSLTVNAVDTRTSRALKKLRSIIEIDVA